jgi:hypothetical protein
MAANRFYLQASLLRGELRHVLVHDALLPFPNGDDARYNSYVWLTDDFRSVWEKTRRAAKDAGAYRESLSILNQFWSETEEWFLRLTDSDVLDPWDWLNLECHRRARTHAESLWELNDVS